MSKADYRDADKAIVAGRCAALEAKRLDLESDWHLHRPPPLSFHPLRWLRWFGAVLELRA